MFSVVHVFLVQQGLSSTWEPSSSGFAQIKISQVKLNTMLLARGVDNSLIRIITIIWNSSSMNNMNNWKYGIERSLFQCHDFAETTIALVAEYPYGILGQIPGQMEPLE